MQMRFKFQAVAFFCLSLSFLYGAPVGNFAFPKILEKGIIISPEVWASLRLGYEGDFVYDGRMRQVKGGTGRVDNYVQNTNGASMTLTLLERCDLYTALGSSNTRVDWRFVEGGSRQNSNLKTEDAFLWRLGARLLPFTWGDFGLGLGGRYSFCDADISSLKIDGVEAPLHSAKLYWRQWQLSLASFYIIDLFTPYIGVKYSRAHAKVATVGLPISPTGLGIARFKNRMNVGMFIGFTFSNRTYFLLNLEGRLIDEEAVTISGELKF